MAVAVAKKPALDLAIVMGPGKKMPHGRGGEEDEGGEEEAPESEEGGEELPPGFEEAFSEAFPEASGDAERMRALKRLIHLCTDSY